MQGIMSTLAQLLQNLTKGRGGVSIVHYFIVALALENKETCTFIFPVRENTWNLFLHREFTSNTGNF